MGSREELYTPFNL